MEASESDQDALEGVVYLDTLKPSQITTSGVPRVVSPHPSGVPQVVAGIDLDGLPVCAGGCGKPVLRWSVYEALPTSARPRLTRLGVRRIEGNGACRACYRDTKRAIPVKRGTRKKSLDQVIDVPELWQEVRNTGGSYTELGARIGASPEYARQLVVKLGLPRVDKRRGQAQFIEELHRFVRFGLGVHEIAQRFSLTDDQLVRKTGRLRALGHTTVRFDSYLEVAA